MAVLKIIKVLLRCTVLYCFINVGVSASYTRRDRTNGAVFLTTYIENGSIKEGQKAALNNPLIPDDNITSYSGFFTINKQYNSNMFFWFFPAEIDSANAPVILWINGGPGRSGAHLVFELNGPYSVDVTNKLAKRTYYLTKMFNVIYVDSPIDTGFSFTNNDLGYPKNDKDIGDDLLKFIKQFYQLFPEYKKNDFYVAGLSYGGKTVPALGLSIDKCEHQLTEKKINLKGLIIANGWLDPITIINRTEFLFNIGLIDLKFKKELDTLIEKSINLVNQKKFAEAIFNENNVTLPLFREKTGFLNTFNYVANNFGAVYGDVDKFIDSLRNGKKLNVGNLPFKVENVNINNLLDDIMVSAKPWLEYLIEKYPILIYNGQYDLVVPYSSTIRFINSMKWSAAEEYKNADRKQWIVDGQLAGYTKKAGKLMEVLVRNAGHTPFFEQPKFVTELFINFTTNNK